MTKLDILKDWYQRVWIDQDLDAIDDFFAPSTEVDGILADGRVSAEDFRALVPTLALLMRDLSIEIVRSIETDDWVWAQISVRGFTAHGVDPIATTAQVAARFERGRIVEAYNAFDFISFFEQAGLLPANSFMLLLSGDRLVPA